MRRDMKWFWTGVCVLAMAAGCDDGGYTTLEADFAVSPEEVDIGVLYGGRTRTVRVTVDNTGAAPLEFNGFAVRRVSGPAVATANSPQRVVAAGGQLTVDVRFTAQMDSTGLYTAELVIEPIRMDPVIVPLTAQVLPVPPCDDNNPCTFDTFEDGACVYTPAIDNTPCDDGNACTYNTVCVEARCVGQVIDCADAQDCTVDRCDPAVGCVFDPIDARCDDEDGCTLDTCSPTFGCTNEPAPTGTVCHFDGCVDIGFCVLGSCQIQPTPNGVPCEDGNPCTLDDTCQEGACASGEEGDIGAYDPLTTAEGSYAVDLCFGATGEYSCGTPGYAAPDAILATGVLLDGRSRVVWRSGFVDSVGSTCTPPHITGLNVEGVPRRDEDPDNGRAAEPPPPLPDPPCSAGIFFTDTDPLTGASGTLQIGVARAASAATLGPPGDPLTETVIKIARVDHTQTALTIDHIDTTFGAVVQYEETLALDDLGAPANGVSRVAIHTDGTDVAVAALAQFHRSEADCDDDGLCPFSLGVPASVWLIAPGAPIARRDLGLLDQASAGDPGCEFAMPVHLPSTPVLGRNLHVRAYEGAALMSARVHDDVCTLGMRWEDAPLYSAFGPGTVDQGVFVPPVDIVLDPGVVGPTAGVEATFLDTTLAPYVAGIANVYPPGCTVGDPYCVTSHAVVAGSINSPAPDEAPTLVIELSFFDAGTTLTRPEAHHFPLGPHELVVARLGQSVRLLGLHAGTSEQISVLAPPLFQGGQWMLGRSMTNGPGQVAGLATKVVSEDGDCSCDLPPDAGNAEQCVCDPVVLEVPHIVVQRFGCLAPAAVNQEGCLEHADCDVGEACRLAPDVCLPPPGCGGDNNEEPFCSVCAGECVATAVCTPPAPDAGPAPDGGGSILICAAEPTTDVPLCPAGSGPRWGHEGACDWTCLDDQCQVVVAGGPDAGPADGGTGDEDGGPGDSGSPWFDGGAAADAGPADPPDAGSTADAG